MNWPLLILGVAVAAAPSIAAFGLMVHEGGWRETLITWGITFGVLGFVAGGFLLIGAAA